MPCLEATFLSISERNSVLNSVRSPVAKPIAYPNRNPIKRPITMHKTYSIYVPNINIKKAKSNAHPTWPNIISIKTAIHSILFNLF